MRVQQARVLHRPRPEHGYLPEGPRALPDGRIAWITIQTGPGATRGAVHVLDPATDDNVTHELPGRPGFALPDQGGGRFLIGMERSLGWFDAATGKFDEIVQGLDSHCSGTIVNDGEPLRAGIVFGMKDTAFREHKAGLYFLRQADGELFRLRDDQLCSNGKVVREAEGQGGKVQLFDIDSPTRLVRRYVLDTDEGTIGEPATAIDLRADRAVPDGMIALPGTDEVVIAMFDPEHAEDGRALRCSLVTGEVLAEYRTPGAAQVTCPALLRGDGGGQLLLTTAAEHLSSDRLARQPNAGCLFVAELD